VALLDDAIELCEAISILERAGVIDYNGHVSFRVGPESFLINSGASDRRRMTPAQICHVSLSGEVLQGDRPPNEVALHRAILAAQPDVVAVVHGHPKWSTLFTVCDTRLPVVLPQGSLVADLPRYRYSHSISTTARAEAVAELIGEASGALLDSHGSVLVGASLVEAVCRAIYLEQNAERFYLAQGLGGAKEIDAEAQEEYRKTLASASLYKKCWSYYSPGGGSEDVR
jgi:Ribulose-5-phosphate 4-epimerase and related epimerases and aldolases